MDSTSDAYKFRKGRYINHICSKFANAKMKTVVVNNKPALCLFALRNIDKNVEILYDYGEGMCDLPFLSPGMCHFYLEF